MTGKEHSNVLLLDLGDSHRDMLSCKTSSDYPHCMCIKFKYE